MQKTNDIKNILLKLGNIENEETINEDIKSFISKVKNVLSKNTTNNIIQTSNVSTSQAKEIEKNIEVSIQDRVEKIYSRFMDDISAASVRPTVKNIIQWLRKHKSISDDDTIKHAFKSIGIDVNSVLNTKTDNDLYTKKNDISKENSSSRADRLIGVLSSAGKHFGKDTNEFKKVLQDIIEKNSSASDSFVVSRALKQYKGNIKNEPTPKPEPPKTPVQQNKEDKENRPISKEDIKIYDGNGILLRVGQIVKLLMSPKSYDPIMPNNKEENFGEIIKIYFDKETNDNVIRVRIEDNDNKPYLYNIHTWQLLADPKLLSVFDSGDSVSEDIDYDTSFNNFIMNYMYNCFKPNILVETIINVMLNEDEEIANDELTPFEIKGLFEILLYIKVAKNKNFDISSVVQKFDNNNAITPYVDRMYKRLSSLKNQYTNMSIEEQEQKFNELYDTTMRRISNEFKPILRTISTNLVDKNKRYSIAIAFFSILITILNDNNNKKVIDQFINKMNSMSSIGITP